MCRPEWPRGPEAGAAAYLTVRQAGWREHGRSGRVHRRPQQEVGDGCGLEHRLTLACNPSLFQDALARNFRQVSVPRNLSPPRSTTLCRSATTHHPSGLRPSSHISGGYFSYPLIQHRPEDIYSDAAAIIHSDVHRRSIVTIRDDLAVAFIDIDIRFTYHFRSQSS